MAIKEIITPRCCLAVQKLFSKLPQVNGYKSNSINTSRLLFGGNISSDTHQSRKSQIVSLRTGLKWNRTRPESVANIHSFITNRSSTALQPYKINLSGHSFSTTPISFIKNVEMGSYNPCSFDIVVIGAGIVGTATARQLSIRYPTYRFALLEKEERVAKHQSHNNSSVIHAGIYYPKHSKYAELCVRGCEMMYKYCKEKDIPYDRNGKLIVAQTRKECDDLLWLYQNSKSNNVVGVRIVDAKEIREIEPYAVGVRAIHSPNTGVVSYRMVTESLAKEFTDSGGRILFGFKVEGFGRNVGGSECSRIKYPLCIYGSGRCVNAKYAVVCAGLHADRLAGLLGGKREPMILPVRGRFLKLKDEYAYLIKGNIYPVPGKNNPFPGVHFTRRADGSVILGPAAFVAFSREGYKWHKISPRDLADMATYLGCYKVPFRFGASAWMEILGSLSTRIQMRFLRRYIPEMKLCYLEDAPPGVAALGVTADGFLEKDLIIEVIDSEDDIIGRVLHVRSAPSPACTAGLAIAELIADRVHEQFFTSRSPPAPEPHYLKSACETT